MVEKQSRHQYIVSLWERVDERVELEKRCARQVGLAGDTLRVCDCGRVDVAAVRFDCHAISCGKFRDANHDVAAARRDVENSQRTSVVRSNSRFPDATPNRLRRATD